MLSLGVQWARGQGFFTPNTFLGAPGGATIGSAIGSGISSGHVNWAAVGGAALGVILGGPNTAAFGQELGGLQGAIIEGLLNGMLAGGTEAAIGTAASSQKGCGCEK